MVSVGGGGGHSEGSGFVHPSSEKPLEKAEQPKDTRSATKPSTVIPDERQQRINRLAAAVVKQEDKRDLRREIIVPTELEEDVAKAVRAIKAARVHPIETPERQRRIDRLVEKVVRQKRERNPRREIVVPVDLAADVARAVSDREAAEGRSAEPSGTRKRKTPGTADADPTHAKRDRVVGPEAGASADEASPARSSKDVTAAAAAYSPFSTAVSGKDLPPPPPLPPPPMTEALEDLNTAFKECSSNSSNIPLLIRKLEGFAKSDVSSAEVKKAHELLKKFISGEGLPEDHPFLKFLKTKPKPSFLEALTKMERAFDYYIAKETTDTAGRFREIMGHAFDVGFRGRPITRVGAMDKIVDSFGTIQDAISMRRVNRDTRAALGPLSATSDRADQLVKKIIKTQLTARATTFAFPENISTAERASLAKNVRTLDLHSIPLTSDILTQLATAFPHVRTLDLRDISLTPDILRQLATAFPHVERLNLKRCNCTDEHIVALSGFASLKSLDISHNPDIRGAHFNALPASLEVFNCTYCNVNDDAVRMLSRLTLLKQLDIRGNQVQGTHFDELPASLEGFSCFGCNVTDVAIQMLSRLTRLKNLDIGGNQVQGTHFNELPASLEVLNCAGCDLTDIAIQMLSCLTLLKQLDIRNNRQVQGTHFGKLPASLEVFNCTYCNVNDDAVRMLSRLTLLKQLYIGDNLQVQGTHFDELPASLERLGCRECNVTDLAIRMLSHLTLLKQLGIGDNLQVQGTHFGKLPASLEVLDCRGCNVTDIAIQRLSHLTLLQILNIEDNRQVQGTHFNKLPASLKKLICDRRCVTDPAIQMLSSRGVQFSYA